MKIPRRLIVLLAWAAFSWPAGFAQSGLLFTNVQRITNQELLLKLTAPAGATYRLQTSSDLSRWDNWMTFAGSAGTLSQTDSAAPFFPTRFYRAATATGANLMTGDHLLTDDGEIVIHPVNHASFVINWKDQWIYNDPVGGSGLYTGIPKANLILISHAHGDHYDASTLTAVRATNGVIVAPKVVYDSMSSALKAVTRL